MPSSLDTFYLLVLCVWTTAAVLRRDFGIFSSLNLLLTAPGFMHKWTSHSRTLPMVDDNDDNDDEDHGDNMHAVFDAFSGISCLFFLRFSFFVLDSLSFCWAHSAFRLVSPQTRHRWLVYLFMSWTTFSRKPCQISSRKPLINCDNFWCLYDMTWLCVCVCVLCAAMCIVSCTVPSSCSCSFVRKHGTAYSSREQHESSSTCLFSDMFSSFSRRFISFVCLRACACVCDCVSFYSPFGYVIDKHLHACVTRREFVYFTWLSGTSEYFRFVSFVNSVTNEVEGKGTENISPRKRRERERRQKIATNGRNFQLLFAVFGSICILSVGGAWGTHYFFAANTFRARTPASTEQCGAIVICRSAIST